MFDRCGFRRFRRNPWLEQLTTIPFMRHANQGRVNAAIAEYLVRMRRP
jgi:hypothetical protein